MWAQPISRGGREESSLKSSTKAKQAIIEIELSGVG